MFEVIYALMWQPLNIACRLLRLVPATYEILYLLPMRGTEKTDHIIEMFLRNFVPEVEPKSWETPPI